MILMILVILLLLGILASVNLSVGVAVGELPVFLALFGGMFIIIIGGLVITIIGSVLVMVGIFLTPILIAILSLCVYVSMEKVGKRVPFLKPISEPIGKAFKWFGQAILSIPEFLEKHSTHRK